MAEMLISEAQIMLTKARWEERKLKRDKISDWWVRASATRRRKAWQDKLAELIFEEEERIYQGYAGAMSSWLTN